MPCKKNDLNLKQFYDTDAVLSVEKTLGFGDQFRGPEGVQLFLYRMFQSVTQQPIHIEIIGVDEGRGTALLRMRVEGQFIQTGKNYKSTILNVLEWNQVTGKIVTHVALDENPNEAIAASQTAAEAYLEKLLWTLFRSSYENLQDVNSPIWNLISDNIQVKVDAYPKDLLSKMEWKGKPDVVKAFKDMNDLHQNMPIYKELTNTHLIDEKILLSNNTDVWVRWGRLEMNGNVVPHFVVHYIFDQDGKLASEEITLAQAARPWQVYPFPAPKQPTISAHDIRKLLDVRQQARLEQGAVPVGGFNQAQKVIPFAELAKKMSNDQQTPQVGEVMSDQALKIGSQQTPQAETKVQQTTQVGGMKSDEAVKMGSQQTPETKKNEVYKTGNDIQQTPQVGKAFGMESDIQRTPQIFKDTVPKKESSKLESGLGKLELDMPIKVHVAGDVNTRVAKSKWPAAGKKVPAVNVEVLGDMKTSIVTFGDGKVHTVRFVGNTDDLTLDNSKVFLWTDDLGGSLDKLSKKPDDLLKIPDQPRQEGVAQREDLIKRPGSLIGNP